MKLKLTCAFFIAILGNCYSQIVINEYSGANMNSTADNYGEFEDWIELYNTGGTDIDITGWYLSDKISNPLNKFTNNYFENFKKNSNTFKKKFIYENFKLTLKTYFFKP